MEVSWMTSAGTQASRMFDAMVQLSMMERPTIWALTMACSMLGQTSTWAPRMATRVLMSRAQSKRLPERPWSRLPLPPRTGNAGGIAGSTLDFMSGPPYQPMILKLQKNATKRRIWVMKRGRFEKNIRRMTNLQMGQRVVAQGIAPTGQHGESATACAASNAAL